MLRDTLYKQSSLDQEQCLFTRDCLVRALGNLLIFPIDMYLTYVTVSVFYFAISLESFLSSTWSQSESNPASELTCLRATKCIPLYKESPVDRGFVTEPKNIVKSIRYTYCLLYKLTVKLIIY